MGTGMKILIIAIVALAFLLLDMLVVDPMRRRAKLAEWRARNQEVQIQMLSEEVQELQTEIRCRSNRTAIEKQCADSKKLRRYMEREALWKKELAAARDEIRELRSKLCAAEAMAEAARATMVSREQNSLR